MKRILAVGLLFALTFILLTSSSAASFRLLGPSGCIWATAPLLYGSPITGNDLRECVKGLISAIQDQNKQLEDLRFARETVSLQTSNLKDNIREIEKRLEAIESIIAGEVIEKGRRR